MVGYTQHIRGFSVHFSTLKEWLDWIDKIHPTQIELGLERIKVVAEKLGILKPTCPVIIVGGTNGKGSTVATLEAIYLAAGYHVGAFTSPVLFKHNEQVRLDKVLATDTEFCLAFEKIALALGDISLTPFEYHTLAALLIFKSYPLDILLLEVGLGGRLDAVNIIDADIAVVTSIDIDHVEWLGNTREAIGFEKAGIFRAGVPAVCGDEHPPVSLIQQAKKIGAPLFCQGKEFGYDVNETTWHWFSQETVYDSLPLNALAVQNVSSALMAVTLLQSTYVVTVEEIKKGLMTTTLPARIEIIQEPIVKIVDVGHNPAAIEMLKTYLQTLPPTGKNYAVFSMLADKDMFGSIEIIADIIDSWFVAPLACPRATSKQTIMKTFHQAYIQHVAIFSSIKEAYAAALSAAQVGDRMIIFGSFHTVREVMLARQLEL